MKLCYAFEIVGIRNADYKSVTTDPEGILCFNFISNQLKYRYCCPVVWKQVLNSLFVGEEFTGP